MTYAELHQGIGVAIFMAITATLAAIWLGIELYRADRKISRILGKGYEDLT